MTDYIERKAIQAALQRKKVSPAEIRYTEGWNDCMMRVKSMVSHFPAADVVPVVYGHFIHDGPRFAGGVDWWHCSNCGKLTAGVEIFFNYCPYCGARMNKRRTHND